MKRIIIFLLLFNLKGFSQDLRLFESTWYLHDLFIDGISNVPPVNPEILFVPVDFYENGEIYTGMCENTGAGELEYIGTTEFNILEMNFLQGECFDNLPHNQEYSDLYQIFWSSLNDSSPISYEIIEDTQIRTLIIISSNNNYAIYKNEVPLSIENVFYSEFLIYPNPVKEILYTNKTSNQMVTVTIYDASGKQLHHHSFENNLSTINVKALNPGLYFIVFEQEDGVRVSKKFIKK